MKKKIIYILGGLLILFVVFIAQYEFSRYQKIKHDVNCTAPCVVEIVPPSSWEILSGKQYGNLSNKFRICDQSATTTDCSKIPPAETPAVEENTPVVVDNSPSGKIDEHLTINNELRDVNFCGKTYKVKQVMIDGVDVVQRIAGIANEFNKGTKQDILRANAICGNIDFGFSRQPTIENKLNTNELLVSGPRIQKNTSETAIYTLGVTDILAFEIEYPSLQINIGKDEEVGSVNIGNLK